MGRIITISGASGSGKTMLAEYLLSLGPQYRMIESVTTRPPRDRDREGEFLYYSTLNFLRAGAENDFLWVTPPIHGTRYGTLRCSVAKALDHNGVSIMVITIEHLSILRNSVAPEHAKNIVGLYILSPGEEVLRERMLLRGDSPDDIEKRINECRGWDDLAQSMPEIPPIRFLKNNGAPKEFFDEATLHLSF